MFSIMEMVLTVVGAVLASSGFWAFLMRKGDSKSAKTRLLVGLAHDRIIQSGMYYINRGWISIAEYDDLVNYLYKPYSELGGNGSAKRIVDDLSRLPHKPPEEKGDSNAAS